MSLATSVVFLLLRGGSRAGIPEVVAGIYRNGAINIGVGKMKMGGRGYVFN
jgi:hypothetical protein